MTDDAKLLKGEFQRPEFSPDLAHMSNYFRSELSACLVKYYLEFEHQLQYQTPTALLSQFTDHTGFTCSIKRLYYLFNRIREVVAAERRASQEFDLDALMLIKNGKFKFRH